MKSLEWTPGLVARIGEIDAQHEELFRRAQRLIEALREGDRTEVLPLLRYLEEYAIQHFDGEERLMHDVAYPDAAEHVAAHEAFCEELVRLAKEFDRSGPTALAALTVHNWLSDWVRTHIGTVDQRFARFVAAARPS